LQRLHSCIFLCGFDASAETVVDIDNSQQKYLIINGVPSGGGVSRSIFSEKFTYRCLSVANPKELKSE